MMGDFDLMQKWQTELPAVEGCQLLREIESRGILSRQRVETASLLGSPRAIFFLSAKAAGGDAAAAEFLRNRTTLPSHHRELIRFAVSPLDPVEKIAFAYNCTKRIVHILAQECPEDSPHRKAMELVNDFIDKMSVSAQHLKELRYSTNKLALELGDPDVPIAELTTQRFGAIAAAESLNNLLNALEELLQTRVKMQSPKIETLDSYCAEAASCAVCAKIEFENQDIRIKAVETCWLLKKTEEFWQIELLFNFLLKRKPSSFQL